MPRHQDEQRRMLEEVTRQETQRIYKEQEPARRRQAELKRTQQAAQAHQQRVLEKNASTLYAADYLRRVRECTPTQADIDAGNRRLNAAMIDSAEYKARVSEYGVNNPVSVANQRHADFSHNKERYAVLTVSEQARWTRERVYLMSQEDIASWFASAKCNPEANAQRLVHRL
jgi:hypothetical protein